MAQNPYDQFGEANPYDRFESLPGGAAVGNPTIDRQRRPRVAIEPGPIAGATAFGAAAGAVAPEILTGLGAAASSFPATAPLGPPLMAAGRVVRSVGRPLTAIQGAAAGAAGETLGQGIEAAGGGSAAAEAGRFAGGMVGGEAATIAKWLASIKLKAPSLSFQSMFEKAIGRNLMERLSNSPESLKDAEKRFVTEELDKLRGGVATAEPFENLYRRLSTAATEKIAVGQSRADEVMRNALVGVEQQRSAAAQTADRVGAARNRIAQHGEEAISSAQQQRLGIANDAEMSDIGTGLRDIVTKRNAEALSKRSADYKATQEERDKIVRGYEEIGHYIRDYPEYRSLVRELKRELTPGRHSEDVAKAFQRILDDIETKVVYTHNGTRQKEVPMSFQAFEEARRKLGEVFRGNPQEGYAAIDAATKRKYYDKLSTLQKMYVDGNVEGPQARLLSSYREGSEALDQYATKAGKKLTAVDRFDENKFLTDASQLPKNFFASRQGISDIIELTGDRTAVVNAAKQFAVNELRDKNATQVKTWMNSNRELLSALPEVHQSVNAFASTLDRGELINRSAQNALRKLPAVEKNAFRAATESGEKMVGEARVIGNSIRDIAQKDASILIGNKFPVDRIKSLIESGDRAEWKVVAMPLLQDRAARAELESAVRQTMAEKAAHSMRGTLEIFERKVRPAVEETGLMSRSQTEDIATRLRNIEALRIPDKEKLGMANRLVIESFAGYGAGIAGRGVSGIINNLRGKE
jgi:hypothetical protein